MFLKASKFPPLPWMTASNAQRLSNAHSQQDDAPGARWNSGHRWRTSPGETGWEKKGSGKAGCVPLQHGHNQLSLRLCWRVDASSYLHPAWTASCAIAVMQAWLRLDETYQYSVCVCVSMKNGMKQRRNLIFFSNKTCFQVFTFYSHLTNCIWHFLSSSFWGYFMCKNWLLNNLWSTFRRQFLTLIQT